MSKVQQVSIRSPQPRLAACSTFLRIFDCLRYGLRPTHQETIDSNWVTSPVEIFCIREKRPGLVLELCEGPTLSSAVMSSCHADAFQGGELYDRIQQKQYYPEVEAQLLNSTLICQLHNLMDIVTLFIVIM